MGGGRPLNIMNLDNWINKRTMQIDWYIKGTGVAGGYFFKNFWISLSTDIACLFL